MKSCCLMMVAMIVAVLVSCQTLRPSKDLYYLHTSSAELSDGLKIGLQGIKDSLLTELVHRPEDSKVLYNLAQVSFLLGEYERSSMYCRKILRMNIDFDPAKVILAKVFLRQHKLELATILADQLQDEELRTNLKAQIYISKGDYSQAVQLLKEKTSKYPDATNLQMNLGLLYLKFNQLSEAKASFLQVLQHDVKHTGAMMHLATIHSKHGEFVQADAIYRQLMRKREDDQQLLFNMLVLSKRQRNYQQATELLVKHDKLLTRYADEELHDSGKRLMQRLRAQLNDANKGKIATNIPPAQSVLDKSQARAN